MTVTTTSNTPAGTFPLTVTATSGALSHTASASLIVSVPVSLPVPIRVNAGGGAYTDSLGRAWLADTGYQGGSTYSVTNTITSTDDPALYRDVRYSASGPLVYQFAVPNGSYNVFLKFAEVYYTSAGQRVFNVVINGSELSTHADVFASVGSAFHAMDVLYPVTVTNGAIAITLVPVIGQASINAIEIVDRIPDFNVLGSIPPQTVMAGGSAQYTVYTNGLNGFTGTVSLSASGLPTGATASFNPPTIVGATGSTIMTVTTSGNTPGGTFPLTITATSGALSHTTTASLTVSAPVSLPLPIRVNAGGGSYTDSLGQAWIADAGYQQGTNYSTIAAIASTFDAPLYRDLRYSASGPLSYQFAVPNGDYTVNLKFAELYYTAAGQRVFDVAINGTTVTSRFDVFASAGGANKALDLSYPVTVSGGVLAITLTPVTGQPAINALEILANSSFAPIRVNAGGNAYTDSLTQTWAADTGYQQGVPYSTASPISGTADQTLYQTLRYSSSGPLTYQFTVANGSRTVNLKFAEIYYTSAGQRVFDVVINGVTVTSHLDIFAAAGAANKALDISYPVTVSGGRVTITLIPVTGLPTVNAIEIR
jgi:hypothetical protein